MAERQLVVFELNSGRYAIDTLSVIEISSTRDIEILSEESGIVEGTIKQRGETIPVINLNKRFNLGENPKSGNYTMIFTKVNNTTIAFTVNRIIEIINLKEEEIEPVPLLLTRAGIRYLTGIAKKDGELISVMDFSCVVSENEVLSITH